jgi:hypothetical protein
MIRHKNIPNFLKKYISFWHLFDEWHEYKAHLEKPDGLKLFYLNIKIITYKKVSKIFKILEFN